MTDMTRDEVLAALSQRTGPFPHRMVETAKAI